MAAPFLVLDITVGRTVSSGSDTVYRLFSNGPRQFSYRKNPNAVGLRSIAVTISLFGPRSVPGNDVAI